MIRDPRIDPQPGDEVRAAGRKLRKIVARDDDVERCLDGAMRYKIELTNWQRWCQENNVVVTKVADQKK